MIWSILSWSMIEWVMGKEPTVFASRSDNTRKRLKATTRAGALNATQGSLPVVEFITRRTAGIRSRKQTVTTSLKRTPELFLPRENRSLASEPETATIRRPDRVKCPTYDFLVSHLISHNYSLCLLQSTVPDLLHVGEVNLFAANRLNKRYEQIYWHDLHLCEPRRSGEWHRCAGTRTRR